MLLLLLLRMALRSARPMLGRRWCMCVVSHSYGGLGGGRGGGGGW